MFEIHALACVYAINFLRKIKHDNLIVLSNLTKLNNELLNSFFIAYLLHNDFNSVHFQGD